MQTVKLSTLLTIILTTVFHFFERNLGSSDNELEFCIRGYGFPFIHTISRNRLENYWNIIPNLLFFFIISVVFVIILYKLKQIIKNKILLQNFDVISISFVVLIVNLIYSYKYFIPNNLECNYNYALNDALVEIIFRQVPISLLAITLFIFAYRVGKLVVEKMHKVDLV
jgi:hypothetical protein